VQVGTVGTLEQVLEGPSHQADGLTNLMGSLRKSMSTCGFTDLKEFQKVDVVLSHYEKG
jgi:IMP dehydrogenase